MKFIEEDIINEDNNYYFFIYGMYSKKQYKFLNVYDCPKIGRHCLYKDFNNLSSKKRLKYKILGIHPI
tara:strand:- start:1040 stop:1243 length:204 start_codon:yes stop_codon:yes gene_type:complete